MTRHSFSRLRFEMMAGDKLEADEAEAGAEGEGGVEEPFGSESDQ